jgi:quaternary ammonium compound-resistance protein SugE
LIFGRNDASNEKDIRNELMNITDIGDGPDVSFADKGRPCHIHPCFVMPWIILIVAALFEIGWAVGLKFTEGFTRLWPSLGVGVALVASVVLLGWSAKTLPIGTAYAVWTGLGAAGTIVCGIFFLGEPLTVSRIVCIGFILAGVIGLKVVE